LPLTEAAATLILPFKELEGAAKFVREIVHSKIFPAAMEVINGTAMAGIHAESAGKAPYFVVFACENVVEAVERQVADLGASGRKAGALDVTTLKADGHKAFWTALSDFPLAFRQRDPNAVAVKANVVLSKFADIIAATEREAKGRGFDAACIAQAGNGIVQGYLPVGSGVSTKAGAVADFFGKIVAEAVQYDGNCIVEAAPREVKEKVSVWGQTRSDSMVMKRLKEKVDPADILNTGRIIA
jgi:FAD/FMN-containing dehydrogenase